MISFDQQKWQSFPRALQLQHIATELSRAAHAGAHNSSEYRGWMQGAYERAISLVDACLMDPQWNEDAMLYELRDAITALYAGAEYSSVSRFLSAQLLAMSETISAS